MTTEDLKDWFCQVAKIITDLDISLNNANRLFENRYENEDWIKKHGFFQHHYYQLWFIISIQLDKLLNNHPNQHYNFHRLFKRLETEEFDEHLSSFMDQAKRTSDATVFIDKDQLFLWIDHFKKELYKKHDIIEKFKTARKKLYAHSDKEAKRQDLKLEEAEELILLCKKIYNCLRGSLTEHEFYFEISDWDIDFVLKQAALGRTRKMKEG